MVVEVVAGIDLLSSVGKVRVFAIQLWTATREMFGHACHTVGAERLTLKATDVRRHHARGKLGIFAEGPVDARPARFGGQVSHRMESNANAGGKIFLAGNISE